MKSSSHRSLPVILLSLSTLSFAQSPTPSVAPDSHQHASTQAPAETDAQRSFARIKTLAGVWEGPVTTVPQQGSMEGKHMHVSLRTTSSGNALLHEITTDGMQDDPITMLYLDSGRLLLTHYCDAGNRPRLVGTVAADGKSIEFDFLDVAGGDQYGHMHHAVFTILDDNHHTEDWVYMEPGNKPVHAHFDLERTR